MAARSRRAAAGRSKVDGCGGGRTISTANGCAAIADATSPLPGRWQPNRSQQMAKKTMVSSVAAPIGEAISQAEVAVVRAAQKAVSAAQRAVTGRKRKMAAKRKTVRTAASKVVKKARRAVKKATRRARRG